MVKSKMLRVTGRKFVETKRRLERKILWYRLLGWKKEGHLMWEETTHKGEVFVTMSHKVVK